MSTLDIKQKIAELIAPSVGIDAAEIVSFFELPKDTSHGDLALPCFRFAKQLKKAPPAISAELHKSHFTGALPTGVAKVNPVGGYLNFFIETSSIVTDSLRAVLRQGSGFAATGEGVGKTVVVEYSSVNIAKPFGIGHLRTTVIGAALARIHAKLGYNVIRINHLGDWGTQFGKVIAGFKRWGSEYVFTEKPIMRLYEIYVRFHAEAEKDPSLEAEGREEFRKLEQGDPENLDLWKRFIDYSMIDFNRIYNLLHVEFDYNTGESFYRDKMDAVIAKLEARGLLKISQGASVVDLEEFGMPPCLIRRSDDASLYATRDLTALLYRKATFNFAKMLYVVGAAQALHFRQFFKVAELMGNDWIKEVLHIEFGWIKFDNQMMSTRQGTIIFLDDVLDEARFRAKAVIMEVNPELPNLDWTAERIGVAAIIFGQLRVRRNKDINFVWDEALTFRGETGPYLQYTHARLTSLMQKYGKSLPDLDADFSGFDDEEKQIIKLFELYPQKLRLVTELYETNILTDYLIDLAGAFNSYWQRIRIISDDERLTRARMQMAFAVRTIIADGLRLLGIEPLERM